MAKQQDEFRVLAYSTHTNNATSGPVVHTPEALKEDLRGWMAKKTHNLLTVMKNGNPVASYSYRLKDDKWHKNA